MLVIADEFRALDVGSLATPVWSRDSKYLYFDNSRGDHPGYRRVKLGNTHSEFVADLKDLHRSWWGGITPDNIPIFSRDISSDEIYALELELPSGLSEVRSSVGQPALWVW